jgi:hypothetical protein
MKSNGTWRIRLAKVLSGAAIAAALFLGPQTPAQGPGRYPIHLPSDWSHRHMVFSQPSSLWEAWELQKEPRFFHQYLRQNSWAFQSANSGAPVGSANSADSRRAPDRGPGGDGDVQDGRGNKKNALHRDWGVSLGNGAHMGQGQFPAKFTFDINAAASCSADYVVYTTSVSGALQIVAFNNLYSTQGSAGGLCAHDGPSVMFAYDTRIGSDSDGDNDTEGQTLTSPALSFNGAKIAYVESRASSEGGAILHILTWKSGDGTIATPKALSTACPATPCVSNIVLNGAQPVTISSPFVDYAGDILYVGDDNGKLHKITGVFNGTPAEVTTGGWPITVNTGNILTAPVFDSTSKNIFVGDSGGRLSFVRVGATQCTGAVNPPCLDSTHTSLGGSIVDAPIVDGSNGRVFWFDGTISNTTGKVVQTDTVLGNSRTVTFLNSGSTSVSNMYSGAFDNTYLTSATPSLSGFLYVCARTTGNRDHPALFRIGFAAATGLMNTTPDGGASAFLELANTSGESCSPITELKNGATDRIFFSVGNNTGNPSAPACNTNQAGCLMSLTLGGTWPPTVVTNAVNMPTTGTDPNGSATGGIVIDNVSGSAQASSIYFSYSSNSVTGAACNGTTGVGCAVKLTQSALN